MNRHQRLIWSLTGDNNELVLQSFATFSRFECALKRAGFVTGNTYVRPDWKRFARETLETQLASIQDVEFTEAKAYLLQYPPKRQVIAQSGNAMQWRENARGPRESDAEYLLRLVRDVRNNLFHGGKYPDGLVSERRLRNSRLLQVCLIILETCLPLNVDVQRFFEDAID